MRFMVLVLPLLACTTPQLDLLHQSTLLDVTRGVVLLDGGAGHGAMLTTTCSFDWMDGGVISDVDLPTAEERIGGATGGWVFGYSPQGVHTILHDEWLRDRDLVLPNVIHAHGTEQRTVWVRHEADRCMFGQQLHQTHDLLESDIGLCSDQAHLLTLGEGDLVWLLDEGRLSQIISGRRGPSLRADLAAIDPSSQTLFSASGTTLRRHTIDGEREWTEDLGQPIRSLTNLGARNGAVAVVEGRGLVFIDAFGDLLAESNLPGDAEVISSERGDDLALVTDNAVHFYEIVDERPKRSTEEATAFRD